MIQEKHCCGTCKHEIPVPTDYTQRNYETVCLKRRKEFNKNRGLTDCPCHEEVHK